MLHTDFSVRGMCVHCILLHISRCAVDIDCVPYCEHQHVAVAEDTDIAS